MVSHSYKTSPRERHVVTQENSRKLAIVSSAFERPKWASDSLADKLARLNQLLLYRTVSVKERSKHAHWIDFSQEQWISEFGSRHYLAVKAAAVRCGMIDVNEPYSTGLYGSMKTVDPFPKSVRLRLDYRDGRTQEVCLKRNPRSKKKPLNEENLKLAGCHLARMLHHFCVVGQPRKSAWDSLAKQFFNTGFHRPFRCDYDRFHSSATALPSYLRSSLTTNKEIHMDTVEEKSPPPPGLEFTGSPSLARSRGLDPVFGLDDTGVVGPIRARRLAEDEKRRPRKTTNKSTLATNIELVHLDVANCQPLLLAAIALERFGRRLPPDASRWLELCEAGELYKAIANWLKVGDVPPYQYQYRNRTLETDPAIWSDKRVKKQFMVAMFGTVCDSASNPVWIAVERLFPSIAALADSIKEHDYRRLAYRCQRLESSIVIDGVCGHLAEHYPTLPVLTVHDCLIGPSSSESLFRDLLTQYFRQHGVTPYIRKEEAA